MLNFDDVVFLVLGGILIFNLNFWLEKIYNEIKQINNEIRQIRRTR